MTCPSCGSENSSCYDTRQMGSVRRRRYKCLSCGNRFATRESCDGDASSKKSICSKCILVQDARALCRTCPLHTGAEAWRTAKKASLNVWK